jgi:hypothetical protein
MTDPVQGKITRTAINTEQLDKLNEVLGGLTSYIDLYISRYENAPQTVVDEAMAVLSSEISQKLIPIKENMISTYKPQIQDATAIVQILGVIKNASVTDLPSVISQVVNIAKYITGPYQPAVETLAILIPKLTLLISNMQQIASYQPHIPNAPKQPQLNIVMPPLSIADLM